MQNKKKSTIIKDAIALCAITLVASVALGFVYEITKDPIAKRQAEAKAAAYKAVYEQAVLVDDTQQDVKDRVEASPDFFAEHGFGDVVLEEVCVAKDSNSKAIGYVMTIITNEGYNPPIKFSLGVASDGTVTGLEVLEMQETKGLGEKATTPEFKGQFANKKVDAFELIKSTQDKASDGEINAITGATITSKAVVNTVNAGVAFANALAKDGIGGVGLE